MKHKQISNAAGLAVAATLAAGTTADAQALVVTTTDPMQPITDFSTTTSTIDVTTTGTSIADLDLAIDLDHTWFGDLTATLTSPTGTVVTLFDRLGVGPSSTFGISENAVGTYTFDDEAANQIGSVTSGSEVTPGTYTTDTVSGLLSTFDGEDPNGTWTLTISDGEGGDQGNLNLWELILTMIASSFDKEHDDIQATASSLGRLTTGAASGAVSNANNNSFASRDLQSSLGVSRANTADTMGLAPIISTQGGTLVGNTFVWGTLSGFDLKARSTSKYYGGGLRVGVDTAFSQNLIAGVSLGYNDVGGSTTVASTEGDFWYLQPYLGFRSGAWSGDFSVLYGQGDYTQTSSGGIGTADSEMWAASLSVERSFALSNGVQLASISSITHGTEDVTGKTGTLATAASTTLDYTEVSTGLRWSNTFGFATPYAGLYLDYLETDASNVSPGNLDIDGFNGRVEVGGQFQLTNSTTLGTGIEAGGIGANFFEVSGFLSLRVAF